MSIYSAYYHNDLPLDGEGLILVPEKFCWFAFFLPLFWALRYRLWVALLAYLVSSLAMSAILEALAIGGTGTVLLIAGYRLIFASAAPLFRQLKLTGRGYRELVPVKAHSVADAERKVLESLARNTQKTTEENAALPLEVTAMDQVNDYNN